jgi:hypothetical protein
MIRKATSNQVSRGKKYSKQQLLPSDWQSTNIGGHTQLITNIRYHDIYTSPSPSTKWKLYSVCTEGGDSDDGASERLHSKNVGTEFRNTIWLLPCPLKQHWCPNFTCHDQKHVIRINFIKFQPFNSQPASVLWQELWSEHTSLQLDMELWQPHGKVLTCVFEFHNKTPVFLTHQKHKYV